MGKTKYSRTSGFSVAITPTLGVEGNVLDGSSILYPQTLPIREIAQSH